MEIIKCPAGSYKDFYNWWIQTGHSYASANTYMSYARMYELEYTVISQETYDKFAKEHANNVATSATKAYFKYLVDVKGMDSIIKDIRIDKIKHVRGLPKTIYHKEVGLIADKMPTKMDKLFTVMLYHASMRISEALKIRYTDFNWAKWLDDKNEYGELIIKKSKGGKSRVSLIKKELMYRIYAASPNKNSNGIPTGLLVFDYGLSRHFKESQTPKESLYNYVLYASDRYRKLLYKVSQQALGYKIRPHMLRHTKAQGLLDNGMNIEVLKEVLGHTDIRTTIIYAKASPEKIKKEMKEFDF